MSNIPSLPVYFSLPLILCFVMCLYRLIKGPHAADRIVVVEIIGIMLICICALSMIFVGRRFLMDIAISWAILGFIGTLTLAKYLEGRNFDE